MYRLTRFSNVQRIADGAIIPFDEGNADYVAYLAWLAEGNEPEPADSIPFEEHKLLVLTTFRADRARMLNVIGDIAGRLQRAGDLTAALAADQVSLKLLDLPSHAAIAAATDAATLKAAMKLAYGEAVAGAPPTVLAAWDKEMKS